MQIVFVVISDNDISLDNMKVFNYRRHAEKYRFELKKLPGFNNATVYEKEVIE